MKKLMILSAAMCVAMAFTSCKSSESAYKKLMKRLRHRNAQVIQLQRLQQSHQMHLLLLQLRHNLLPKLAWLTIMTTRQFAVRMFLLSKGLA